MGPTIDMRIKTSSVGIPLLHVEFEVKATKHNSSAK
jgi:hypothetical protein